jgi:hypothetical protein
VVVDPVVVGSVRIRTIVVVVVVVVAGVVVVGSVVLAPGAVLAPGIVVPPGTVVVPVGFDVVALEVPEDFALSGVGTLSESFAPNTYTGVPSGS